jgi:hypothetical protein
MPFPFAPAFVKVAGAVFEDESAVLGGMVLVSDRSDRRRELEARRMSSCLFVSALIGFWGFWGFWPPVNLLCSVKKLIGVHVFCAFQSEVPFRSWFSSCSIRFLASANSASRSLHRSFLGEIELWN